MTARPGNGLATVVLLVLLVLWGLAVQPSSSQAQVGHDPARSPFRDIGTRQSIGFLFGSFGGNTAIPGAGARPGSAFGARLKSRLSGPLDLMVSVSYINSSRIIVDPTRPDSTRRSGPVKANLISADLGLTLALTGTKTWHGLAPWIGFGIGVVTPVEPRTDPGGYRTATNFSLVPKAGVRLRLSDQLGLDVELRDNTMRYEWPSLYFDPRDASNVQLPPPILQTGRDKNRQLTHNFTLSAGVSYHFNF